MNPIDDILSGYPSSRSPQSPTEKAPSRRPRLLFLTWYFPPARAVACVRTWSMAKYLARLGWEVTAVTPHPALLRHADNPDKTQSAAEREGIRRILTDHPWRCLVPDHLHCWNTSLGWFAGGACRSTARILRIDSAIGWAQAAERACRLLTPHDVDLILACGPPFVTFRLATRLSDRLGRPYILDYRDTWSVDPHADRPAPAATIREETKVLAGCAAATIVSPSLKSLLDRDFHLGPKLHVLTNGYDSEELAGVKPHEFGHFAIVYAGRFYPPKRVISPVMAALKRLKEFPMSGTSEWFFHYYGTQGNYVREEALRFGVMTQVVLHGDVPRADVLSAVRGAGVAVVVTSVFEESSPEDRGIVTGKVFEALGLRTPVLLVAPSGSDAEFIAETTGLARSFTGSDVNGMASFLADVMSGMALKPKDLRSYSWENIAKRLDAILREVGVNPA